MKTQKVELDIDFIGGQGDLTEEEEKALSDFFKKKKLAKKAIKEKIKVRKPVRPKIKV